MAHVVHTIKKNQYLYNHHRVGDKIVSDYIGPVGSGGNIRTAKHGGGAPSKVTQHDEAKPNKYTNEKLLRQGTIGKHYTELWAGDKVTTKEIQEIKSSFNRLPDSVQNQVGVIEIYGTEGKSFKIGDKEFKEGGHWDAEHKTIRIFDESVGRKWIKDFKSADHIMAHEAGHGYWLKIIKESQKETLKPGRWIEIHDRTLEIRRKKIQTIEKKHDIYIEKQIKTMDSARDAYYNNPTELNKKEYKKEEKNVKKLFKDKEEEIEKIRVKFDPEKHAEAYKQKKMPISTKLNEFGAATRSEGGLTPYSDAYVKDNDRNYASENFAEAMKVFYSGYLSSGQAKQKRNKYPATYKAFKDIVLREFEGHAVELKHKPLSEAI